MKATIRLRLFKAGQAIDDFIAKVIKAIAKIDAEVQTQVNYNGSDGELGPPHEVWVVRMRWSAKDPFEYVGVCENINILTGCIKETYQDIDRNIRSLMINKSDPNQTYVKLDGAIVLTAERTNSIDLCQKFVVANS